MADNELFGISEQLEATEQQKSTEQPSATDTNVATTDTISRAAVVDAIDGVDWYHQNQHGEMVHGANPDDHQAWYKAEDIYKAVENVPSAQQWISCSERLPEDLEPVNITWVNHEPEPYYHDIKNKNFVATGIHYRGQWYWYSTTCADYLGEYGSNDIDLVDDAIEIVAWCPLPEPWKGEEHGTPRSV